MVSGVSIPSHRWAEGVGRQVRLEVPHPRILVDPGQSR
jgi:hypothetical protein